MQKNKIHYLSWACSLFLVSFIFYQIGQSNNENDMKELGKLLKKYEVELNWAVSDQNLLIQSHNSSLANASVLTVVDFSTIDLINYKDEEIKVVLKKEYFMNYLNFIFLGLPLKNDINQLRGIVATFDNFYRTNKEYLITYNNYIYPYKLKLCDIDATLTLIANAPSCIKSNHVKLEINSRLKSSNLDISYYPDWANFKLEDYMIYSKQGVSDKLENYRKLSAILTTNFTLPLDEYNIEYINSEDSTIGVNKPLSIGMLFMTDNNYYDNKYEFKRVNEIKRTTRKLKTDIWVDKKSSDSYIEKDLKLSKYYTAVYDQDANSMNEDLNYIFTTLKGKTSKVNSINEAKNQKPVIQEIPKSQEIIGNVPLKDEKIIKEAIINDLPVNILKVTDLKINRPEVTFPSSKEELVTPIPFNTSEILHH